MDIYLGFERKPLWFENPCEVISCHEPGRLKAAFRTIERWLDGGLYAAGFLSYEAGYAFEHCFRDTRRREFPLLCLGAYRRPRVKEFPRRSGGGYEFGRIRTDTPCARYAANIRRIREYIAGGDVYQITYCLKEKFRFRGNPRRLFRDLYRFQPVPYSAYIEMDSFAVLSLSPERFLKKTGDRILSEPMKGTWPRGSDARLDRRMRRQFAQDAKNRAENVMIADLLRNDLGRIGRDIRAPKLFTITPYRTLFQMTSTVIGALPRETSLYDLFAAVFPSGSVTGAPKIRAMEIIREIEKEERKIYTGAIGYIAPDRDLYFSIPIRTLLIRAETGEMGIGGGIVWDSTPRGEWDEGRLKARFLREIAAGAGRRIMTARCR